MIHRKNRRKKRSLAKKQQLQAQRRSLRHETLEDRRVLTLLGVEPLDLPIVAYNVDGNVNYDSTTNAFTLDGTPTTIETTTTPFGLFFGGDIDINIEVDETGALVGGSTGDDLILSGDVDTNGDFVTDASGVLLTGEVTGFGFEDTTGISDLYDFRFTITGGLLAGLMTGKDIGVTTSSENSTFTGDFNVDFGGDAKGNIGAIDPIVVENPDIDIEKLVNGINADTLADAATIAAGDTAYFTYRVTNTGDVAFDQADVVVTDDNGTPGDASDDVSTTSGEITLIAASDVGADGILSPGEVWQYQYTTVADDLTPSDLISDGVYQLGNHPDGNAGPPAYGLRLDGLTTGDQNDVHTFSFDPADGADVELTVDGDMITISGTVFGGLVQSGAYVPGESGLWQIDFTYDGAAAAAGDDDYQVASALAGTNTGVITKLFGDLAAFDLVDEAGSHSFSFQLGDEADDLGHRGFDGISGWGWMNHSPAGDPSGLGTHLYASDWLFTAERKGQPFYKNTAVVTAPGASDMDMSHYVNGDPDPTEIPKISYNVDGTVSYDSTTDVFSVDATPTALSSTSVPFGLFFDGDLDINIVVDENGDLVSGVGGDDFVLAGAVDTDGDFVADVSGVLLTGEIIEFTSEDSGGTSDNYEFRFAITGGLLASLYEGQDLLVNTNSENSSFAGDFTIDFGGNAKGQVCAVDPIVEQLASIGNYVFIDNDDNGLQNTGDQGVNGITVNLLNSEGVLIASTVTDFDASGNAGYYLFYNLDAGDYIVEFEVPEGVQFTIKDAGDDTRDSDVDNATNRTDVISVVDGEHRRDIDAGVKAAVQTEEMVYKVQDYINYCQNKRAGKVKSLDIEFNSTSNELLVSVDFKSYRGRLTDGFTIVITGGEWPAGHEDKYAIFYFDADIHNRHGGPMLNVFGYNGKYDGKSYRDSDGDRGYDPDRIATSADNSDGWVKELTVDTFRHRGRWHRTMTFRIDATKVNSHVPLQGGDWEGASIGNMASFALDTYDGLYTRYNNDGFVKCWWACRHGWMDGDWVTTTCETVVVDQPIEDYFDDFGWVVTDFVENSDGDPPTDENDEESDLDWAGSVDVALEELFV